MRIVKGLTVRLDKIRDRGDVWEHEHVLFQALSRRPKLSGLGKADGVNKLIRDTYTPTQWFDRIRLDPTRETRVGANRVNRLKPTVWDDLNAPLPKIGWEDLDINAYGRIVVTKRGEKKIRGGHLVGEPVGNKTLVPESWSEDDFTYAVCQTLRDPQFRKYVDDRHNDRRELRREVHGVIFRANYYANSDGTHFSHCYPVSGDDVRSRKKTDTVFDTAWLTDRDKKE